MPEITTLAPPSGRSVAAGVAPIAIPEIFGGAYAIKKPDDGWDVCLSTVTVRTKLVPRPGGITHWNDAKFVNVVQLMSDVEAPPALGCIAMPTIHAEYHAADAKLVPFITTASPPRVANMERLASPGRDTAVIAGGPNEVAGDTEDCWAIVITHEIRAPAPTEITQEIPVCATVTTQFRAVNTTVVASVGKYLRA